MIAKLARLPALRRVILPLLRVIGSVDVTIHHPWWPEFRLRLNGYRHRGYWYKGRNREHRAMAAIAAFVKPGDTVFDVGGHIGFVTLHMRGLVGETGKVVVFEPGPNNLPYLRSNIAPFVNVKLAEAACGDHSGEVDFWIESLTGQNNSLNRQYKNFEVNRKSAYSQEDMSRITVPMITIDSYIAASGLRPSLLKIDVEGAESLVLRGAERCLAEVRPRIVVEVSEHSDEVATLLRRHSYRSQSGDRPEWICTPEEMVDATSPLL